MVGEGVAGGKREKIIGRRERWRKEIDGEEGGNGLEEEGARKYIGLREEIVGIGGKMIGKVGGYSRLVGMKRWRGCVWEERWLEKVRG